MPVPLSATLCVPPLALSLMDTIPVRMPVVDGVKVTAMVQVPEAATGIEVEQVVLGSSAKSPLALMAVIVSALPPLLVSVTDCAAAVVPTTVLPKVWLDGVSNTPGRYLCPHERAGPYTGNDAESSGAQACGHRRKCHSNIAT